MPLPLLLLARHRTKHLHRSSSIIVDHLNSSITSIKSSHLQPLSSNRAPHTHSYTSALARHSPSISYIDPPTDQKEQTLLSKFLASKSHGPKPISTLFLFGGEGPHGDDDWARLDGWMDGWVEQEQDSEGKSRAEQSKQIDSFRRARTSRRKAGGEKDVFPLAFFLSLSLLPRSHPIPSTPREAAACEEIPSIQSISPIHPIHFTHPSSQRTKRTKQTRNYTNDPPATAEGKNPRLQVVVFLVRPWFYGPRDRMGRQTGRKGKGKGEGKGGTGKGGWVIYILVVVLVFFSSVVKAVVQYHRIHCYAVKGFLSRERSSRFFNLW